MSGAPRPVGNTRDLGRKQILKELLMATHRCCCPQADRQMGSPRITPENNSHSSWGLWGVAALVPGLAGHRSNHKTV